MAAYLREDPTNPQNDYNHWKECHEALDNHLSDRYLDIHSIEDLEALVSELLEIVESYEFTGAKIFIRRLIQHTKNSPLLFEDAFSEAIDEMDEKIEHKIMERKGGAKKGLMEKVKTESIPPFEIHEEPWGEEIYFCSKRIYCDVESIMECDKPFPKDNLSPKCSKLLAAFIRAEDFILPVKTIQSSLCIEKKTVQNIMGDLRHILASFRRQTGFTINITHLQKDKEYDYYRLIFQNPTKN